MRDRVIQKRGYTANTLGDELSLEIASYPVTANYLARRLSKHGTAISELCCGIGISLIEFSNYFTKVVGVDNDVRIIELARENLNQAEVGNCELIVGDVADVDLLASLKSDIVAYDIPYWSDHNGMVKKSNPDINEVIEILRTKVTPNIVIYAPPHTAYEHMKELDTEIEFQEIWIDGRHDRNFVYLGNTIEKQGMTKVALQI